MIGLNVRRIRTIATRHAIVFKRSPHRWFDVAAPAIDSILFGSLAVVLAKSTPGDSKTVPTVLTGLLLFHILFASNLALSTGFLEETWTRSLLNLMVTPLRETEYLIGTARVRSQQGLHRDGLRLVHRAALLRVQHHDDRGAAHPLRDHPAVHGLGAGPVRDRPGAAVRRRRRGPGLGTRVPAVAALGRVLRRRRAARSAPADRESAAHDPRVRRGSSRGRRRAAAVGRDRDRRCRRPRAGGALALVGALAGSSSSASGATSLAIRECCFHRARCRSPR